MTKKRTKRMTRKELEAEIRKITAINADTQRALEKIQALDEIRKSSRPAFARPWATTDGVIMDGKKQPDLVRIPPPGISTENTEKDDYVKLNMERNAFLLRLADEVERAKKDMEDAGVSPSQIGRSHAEWQEQQKRQETLYSVSKLSFWKKVRLCMQSFGTKG